MNNELVKMSKVVKDNKKYYNVYLFGIAVKAVSEKQRLALYYSVKEYCRANNIEIEEVVKVTKDETKTNKSK